MLNNDLPVSEQTMINLPPRIRMSILYAVAQSVNGHVINTSNLSESYVGYDTLWGDSVGAISPLHDFTKSEILKIGSKLLIPEFLIDKAPADGLCGQTDEDRFGFTYKVLDKYLRTGVCEDAAIKEKIDTMHRNSQFKREMIQLPHFVYPTGSISPVIAKE